MTLSVFMERLAFITASAEGVVNHARLREVSTDHPADITKMLAGLVRDGLLAPKGSGRGMEYFLPWQTARESLIFDAETEHAKPPELDAKPPELDAKPPELDAKPPELDVYLDWNAIPMNLQTELLALAGPVANSGKVKNAQVLRQAILSLCQGRFLGLRVLARVLNRDSDDLRKRTLTPMVQEAWLRAAFSSARDPRQAYTANTMKVEP